MKDAIKKISLGSRLCHFMLTLFFVEFCLLKFMSSYSASNTDTLSKRSQNPLGNVSSFMSSLDWVDNLFHEKFKLPFGCLKM